MSRDFPEIDDLSTFLMYLRQRTDDGKAVPVLLPSPGHRAGRTYTQLSMDKFGRLYQSSGIPNEDGITEKFEIPLTLPEIYDTIQWMKHTTAVQYRGKMHGETYWNAAKREISAYNAIRETQKKRDNIPDPHVPLLKGIPLELTDKYKIPDNVVSGLLVMVRDNFLDAKAPPEENREVIDFLAARFDDLEQDLFGGLPKEMAPEDEKFRCTQKEYNGMPINDRQRNIMGTFRMRQYEVKERYQRYLCSVFITIGLLLADSSVAPEKANEAFTEMKHAFLSLGDRLSETPTERNDTGMTM